MWCEEPGPIAFLIGRQGFVGAIFFSVFFAMVYFATEADSQRSFLWFLGFIAVLVYGSFLGDCVSALRSLYAITNKRLIILHPSLVSTEIDSYYAYDIDFVKKKKSWRGSGNLLFAAVTEKGGKRTYTAQIGFFGVDNVDAVEKLVLNLREPKVSNQLPEPPVRTDY